MVSIPRDLYYNGRKINSVYALYGMEELKRALSFVTGYQIDKFILIDMYAFIEVIDLIGGIDVNLDQPVIDPTYKTFDGGKWGTLYYRAGDHHLSGKQALRLARTRHTSSDFARAERQQMIIQALQEKARNFGFGDADSLTRIAQQVLSKVETDVSLAEGISYYFRYQNFTVSRGHVLSSGNVLESKYTGDLKKEELNCSKSAQSKTSGGKTTAAASAAKTAAPSASSSAAGNQNMNDPKDPCEEIDRGAYILEPRNGNWNSVRWYFHQIIEGQAS